MFFEEHQPLGAGGVDALQKNDNNTPRDLEVPGWRPAGASLSHG